MSPAPTPAVVRFYASTAAAFTPKPAAPKPAASPAAAETALAFIPSIG